LGWLDDWLGKLEEDKAPQPIARAVPAQNRTSQPRRLQPEIHEVRFQIRGPLNGDAGRVEAGFYSVSDGVLTMRDAKGSPIGTEHRLGPDDNPKVIAARLGKEAWGKARGESDFNRPLNYPRWGIA
jgi:hypothetical protein